MIEHAANRAIDKTNKIARVLQQAVDHPNVSAVEAGDALAYLQELSQTLQLLKQVSGGISLEDVINTEVFLDKLEAEGTMPEESFLSLRKILEQQKKLAGLQNLDLPTIQKTLRGTNVNFDLPLSLRISRWLENMGYELYIPHKNTGQLRWIYTTATNITASNTRLGLYRSSTVWEGTERSGFHFLGIGTPKITFYKTLEDERIAGLEFYDKVWLMRICGSQNIPESLQLAQNISQYWKVKINTLLAGENRITNKRHYYQQSWDIPPQWKFRYYAAHFLDSDF